ncbi:unnamed protein product, partial [Symbiodinium sp. KB8]
LGASASQVGANGDYRNLLGILNDLKVQIQSSEQVSAPKPAPKAALAALPAPDARVGDEGDEEHDQGEGDEEHDQGEGDKEDDQGEGDKEDDQGEGNKEDDQGEWHEDLEEEDCAEDSEQEEQAEEEELSSNQAEAMKVLRCAKGSGEKGVGLGARPVATPARSCEKIVQKLPAPENSKPKSNRPTPNPPSNVAAAAEPAASINSTTHKKEYMRLDRDAPGIHEETKYWCTLEETAEDSTNVAPGDIHGAGAEIRKEVGFLAGLLVELPEGDDLRGELEAAQAKLNKLARKLLA